MTLIIIEHLLQRDERADTSSPAIPKLTLKIGPSSPRPITPDVPRKL
jgi:hypothetical protein